MSETAVRERPIPFKAEMRTEIEAGRKTQTRRIVEHSNSTTLGYTARWAWDSLLWNRPHLISHDPGPDPFGGDDYEYLHVPAWNPKDGPVPESDADLVYFRVRSRFEVGDRLWVKHKMMQRKAETRLWLEVEAVRVQRLNQITDADILAEGRPDRAALMESWDRIHAKHPDRQWAANPWVWAITFKPVDHATRGRACEER